MFNLSYSAAHTQPRNTNFKDDEPTRRSMAEKADLHANFSPPSLSAASASHALRSIQVWLTFGPSSAATHCARFLIPRQRFFRDFRHAGPFDMLFDSRAVSFATLPIALSVESLLQLWIHEATRRVGVRP